MFTHSDYVRFLSIFIITNFVWLFYYYFSIARVNRTNFFKTNRRRFIDRSFCKRPMSSMYIFQFIDRYLPEVGGGINQSRWVSMKICYRNRSSSYGQFFPPTRMWPVNKFNIWNSTFNENIIRRFSTVTTVKVMVLLVKIQLRFFFENDDKIHQIVQS